MNTRQKPAGQLADKRRSRAVVPRVDGPPVTIPEPPEGVSEYARDRWIDFFQTPVSGLVDMKRDGEHLSHWCRCVHERHRLWELWSAQPLRKQGDELKGNPLFSQIRTLTHEIERAEMLFGMTPLYKMRLTGALDLSQEAERRIGKRLEEPAPVEEFGPIPEGFRVVQAKTGRPGE